MAGYYASISNISGGKSSVESSAYISRDKIHDDTHDKYFNYSRHQQDNTFENIVLCENAPKEWQDKEKLWNAVEQQEQATNARKAKQWILAIPQELNQEQAEVAVKEFQAFLAYKGMCSQANIHEPESKRSAKQIEKNKHVHVLATQRLINKDGEWEQTKQKQQYANDIDKDGKPRYNPNKPTDTNYRIPKTDPEKVRAWEEKNGRKFDMAKATREDKSAVQKIGKKYRREWVRVTTENNPLYAKELVEESRAKWAEVCNKHLSKEHQIDHRSYDRQGIDKVAQIHEGIGYRNKDDRVEYNENVKRANADIEKLKTSEQERIKQIREELDAVRTSLNHATDNRGATDTVRATADYHKGADDGKQQNQNGIRQPNPEVERIRIRADRLAATAIRIEQEICASGSQNEEIGAGKRETEPVSKPTAGNREFEESIRLMEERGIERKRAGVEMERRGGQRESRSRENAETIQVISVQVSGIRDDSQRIANEQQGIRQRIAELRTRVKESFERACENTIQKIAEIRQKPNPAKQTQKATATESPERTRVSLRQKLPAYKQKADEINQQNRQETQENIMRRRRGR